MRGTYEFHEYRATTKSNDSILLTLNAVVLITKLG